MEYLGVADALAYRHRVPGHDLDDIRQVARLGLIQAAQRYRPEMGYGFVQYASPTITGTIKHYLRDQSWVVRPPRSLQELRLGVRAVRGRLAQELGREPSIEEISEATGTPRAQVSQVRGVEAAMAPVAIEPLDSASEDDATPGYTVSTLEPGFEQVEQHHLVATALKDATAQELELIRMRFVEELTQTEIAARLGVSQMQVSRLLRRLLDRMRRRLAA